MGIAEAVTAGGLALASGISARSQRKAAKSAAAAQEQAAQAANETEWKMYQQGARIWSRGANRARNHCLNLRA